MLKPSTMSEIDIRQGLKLVLAKIEQACSKRNKVKINCEVIVVVLKESRFQELSVVEPRLVAVSKTKPVEAILEAYNEGQRNFGENYVQELEEKANNKLILEKCKEIKWHFIGHLQGNKINKVISIPNLYIIETIDSKKKAKKLNNSWAQFDSKIRTFVQVNTSGEKEKSGVSPDEVIEMVKFVKDDCPSLQFNGLMTIGQYGYNPDDGPNPDFLKLVKCREDVCKALNLSLKDVELSMGMSDDYEQAIELGSTNIRVGSAIFGYRPKKHELEK
ncbi:hypothetical protein WA026_017315 [Henosepilachna vigintioctopunctata]|uniref:Pyridoxal phosphate homeostasis protein n=1 Tax=Henosepilachna vigintioctopunctata TaxID=420089 RepID=A0AAW1UH31_9CUCU